MLPKVLIETVIPAEEMRERVSSFDREKGTQDSKPRNKLAGMFDQSNEVSK
jgi:hypothetical protein